MYVLGDFATGARRNTDFAMGSRYGSLREILYVLEDFTTGFHNAEFAMGFRYRSPREIL